MIDPAVADPCASSTLNRLNPPPARSPKLVQGVAFAFYRRKAMRNWIKRHERFDPYRFRGTRPAAPAWLAFGGGARRCLGADFAIAEMISCCLRCCRISGSRPMPPPMRSRTSAESPTSRNSAAAS
jgi:Cytochrome P450